MARCEIVIRARMPWWTGFAVWCAKVLYRVGVSEAWLLKTVPVLIGRHIKLEIVG